ncbi:NACHT domain-containing protein [Micromonospora sp. NPDC048170]|uniref:NACHT domain-containing protein n=1 Tax=Micromonospora sp. NPDC048170 TaxID=3154819 RepID=UPI0033FFD7E6
MIEGIAAEVIGGAIAGAGQRVAAQISQGVRRRRNRESDEDAVAGILSTPRLVKSLRFTAVSYPAGMDRDSFRAFMTDPITDGIAFETLVATLARAPQASKNSILSRWVDDSKSLLPDVPDGQRADFVKQVFGIMKEECDALASMLDDQYPTIAEKIHSQAHYQRLASILEAIERRLASPAESKPTEADEEQRFLRHYLPQATRHHGHLTPPDFDRRKRVPISEIYVSPNLKRVGVSHEEVPLRLDDLIRLIDRTVLLGDPGGGKSTAATVTMHYTATGGSGLVPILVTLRDFAAGKVIDESILQHIEKLLNVTYQCAPPQGLIERLLISGRCLVIFDGLDELLDTSKRREVTDLVGLFCSRYPLTRVLVTSRRVGYDQAPMDPNQFTSFEIFGFNEDQIQEYVSKWFKQDDSLSSEEAFSWTSSFMEESSSVPDLRANPLLLALMCIIYRGEHSIPRNRPAVYERCATMLFEKWDSSRKIHVELRVGRLVDPAMKYLAHWILTQSDGSEGVPESVLVRQTTTYLRQHDFEDPYEAEAAATEFVTFCRGRAWVFSDAGSTADGENLYKFTHRTFLEYFAAYHLTRTHDSPEKLARTLAPKISNAEWDVIAQLAVQICEKHSESGAERFFCNLLNEKVKRRWDKRANILLFLCSCLPFVTITHPTFRKLIRQTIDGCVQTSDRVARTTAPLAALGSLMASATGPREALVKDEIRSNLITSSQSDSVHFSTNALQISAMGWVGLFVGPGPTGPINRFQWINFCASLFDDVYHGANPEAKSHRVVRAYAWSRGHIKLPELHPATNSNKLSTLWKQTTLTAYGIGLISTGSALTDWFLTGYTDFWRFHDPQDLLDQLGQAVQQTRSPFGPRIGNRNPISDHVLREAANQKLNFKDYSPNAIIGGCWLTWSSLRMREHNELLELLAKYPAGLGRATPVIEAMSHPDVAPADESTGVPHKVREELARWQSVERHLRVPQQYANEMDFLADHPTQSRSD